MGQNDNTQLQNFSSQFPVLFFRNKWKTFCDVPSRANFGLSWTWREKAWFPPRRFLQYNLIGVSDGHDFLPTQRTRLVGPPRYLERVRKTYKKFSRDTWIKVSAQNMSFCQNILTWLWASFFKISIFFTFSWHIIWLVCRKYSFFFNWRKEKGQADLPDTLNVFVKLTENF